MLQVVQRPQVINRGTLEYISQGEDLPSRQVEKYLACAIFQTTHVNVGEVFPTFFAFKFCLLFLRINVVDDESS